jgi:hypothetical protein
MTRTRISRAAMGLVVLTACGLGAAHRPAHGQCNEPVLTSGQMVTVPDGTTPRFTQAVSYWSAIAVRPPGGTDWDLGVYSSAGPAPTCASGLLATSVAGGSAVDIVVGDFNHNLHGEYRARVYQYSGSQPGAEVEWDDGPDALQVNGPHMLRSFTPNDIIDCYDVFLSAGTTYRIRFSQDSPLHGVRMLLFRNPASSPYWAGRSSRILELAGDASYTPPADDFYCIVVVNDLREDAFYTLSIGNCLSPFALSSGVVANVLGQSGNRSINQTVPYFTAIGTRTDGVRPWEAWMYSTPGGDVWPVCYTGLLASSGLDPDGGTHFVVGDFNSGANPTGTYYPRIETRYFGEPSAKVEWDSGSDQLSVNAPPISRTTGASDILECWDVFLELSTLYSIHFEHDGPADLKVFVFRNPGAGYWVGRGSAYGYGSGTFGFNAPQSDWYGVVVVNDNGLAGTYRLAVSTCPPPPVLTSGTPFGALGTTTVEIQPTQPTWTAVGTQWTSAADDYDLDVYAEPTGSPAPTCVSGLLESSTSNEPFVEFVAGDFHFNPPGTYFPRATGGGAPGGLLWEWDHGNDVLAMNAEPVARDVVATDLLECWDVYLEAGKTYTVFFQPDGAIDLKAYVFSNPAAAPLWKGRDEADLVTAGHAHYAAPVTGWYGVVVAKSGPATVGSYRLGFYEPAVAVDPAPGSTRLASILPNPARDGTRIHYELAQPADVAFEITNVAGRRVGLVSVPSSEVGRASVNWAATDTGGRRLSAGVYFVRMMVDGSLADRSRLVLVP